MQKKLKENLVLIFEKEIILDLYQYGFNIDLKKKHTCTYSLGGVEYKASQFKQANEPIIKNP